MFAIRHARLMEAHGAGCDPDVGFDAHVLACLLASALEDRENGGPDLTVSTGLDPATLAALVRDWFPTCAEEFAATGEAGADEIEEEMLRGLLLAHARLGEGGGSIAPILARAVARRALRPDHLWQDLGLFDRSDLNRLLARHFPTLHAGNTANMRWKKYFYRKLCEAEGFSLCSAPSCAECADFADCFGSEDGESRMAERRRTLERTSPPLAAE